MDQKSISIDKAWDALCMAYDREARRAVNYEGRDWYQITPEERQVFGLSLKAMPWVVTAYRFYEELLGLTETDLLPRPIMEVIRHDLAARIGMEPLTLCEEGFRRFAQILYVGNRTADAWYAKHRFWCVRRGIVKFKDETDGHPFFW